MYCCNLRKIKIIYDREGVGQMQEEKQNFRKRFVARYGSGGLQRRSETVVIRGQYGVTVYGCRKILLYSPCEIRLQLGKRELSVLGRGLFCTCFSAGCVTVEGDVGGVLYQALAEETQSHVRGGKG